MKPASLILLLCILCISITQNAQAIDIVIPDGKGGKYFCDYEKGYSAVESEKIRLQGQGYEVHLTIEDTNCWISYIIQSSKEGKTESSRYNISKGTSGCGEIYAKAGCGTDTKRGTETMCSEEEAADEAGRFLGNCTTNEAEYCKKYRETGGACNAGKCVVESLEGSGCQSEYTVVAKGRWTPSGGVWDDIIYYSAIAPSCNPGCPPETPLSYGCNTTCDGKTPEEGKEEEEEEEEESPEGDTPKPKGSGQVCSEIEAVNAAKDKGGGYLITSGDGKCWRYAIGENGTFMYPYNEEIGNPDSECCPAYGRAGCVGFCRVKGQAVYNFSSGGEMPSNNAPACNICDYLKSIEELMKKQTDSGGAYVFKEAFNDEEFIDKLKENLLTPSEETQENIDTLLKEVDIKSDSPLTVESVKASFQKNVVITEEENKSYEEDYSKIMIGIFDGAKDYILKAPAFNIFSDKKITASGECKFQIPSPMGWYNSETAYFDIDFCKYKDALDDMSIVFRLIAVIAAVAIILGS